MNKEVYYKHTEASDSIGFLLWQLHMLWQRKIKVELDKLDITHTQFVLLSVLAWLSKSQKIVTQTDIAIHSKTDRMMVSKVLRTLENKKFIIRSDNKEDARIKMISLTRQGTKILQQAVVIVEDIDTDFFALTHHNLSNLIKDFNYLVKKNSEETDL